MARRCWQAGYRLWLWSPAAGKAITRVSSWYPILTLTWPPPHRNLTHSLYRVFIKYGNSFISPTRSGTTEIYIFGPAGAGIQNKICNIHLIDIVLQVQKYLEVQVFLVLQKYLEYQKQWNCSKLSERDTDMQNNIVKLRQRVRQG